MKKKAPSAWRALPVHSACRRLQPRRGFSLLSALTSSSSFFPPKAQKRQEMQLTRRKLLHLCSAKLQSERERGVAGGGAGRSSALQQGGRGSSGTARSPESPASRAASAAPGAAGRGASARQGPPRCTWPSPALPSPRPPPRRSVGGVQRTDRGGSGVCRALSAFRSLAGSLCKPSGVGSTAGEAAVPGSRRRSGRSRVCLRVFCERAGCSGLTTRVYLGRIWRQGSRRSYEWCSHHLWVRRRGGQRGAFGAPGPGAASAPGWARGRCLWPPRGDFERLPRSWTEWGGPGEDSQGPAAGPTASFSLPAYLLLFILASFLPFFQSVELLSRQVRSRSRSQGWPRKTSVALKGVLLGAVGRGWLPLYPRWAWGPRPFDQDFPARTKPQAKGEREVRTGWGAVHAEFSLVCGHRRPWFL
ncbi:uncharacterized protein LOC141583507 [Saimiri boliviensis]|uniref:uncharacterized protein LOC141583507 n=1 Tax=Saimiri boliviensis TaxID=27679 RepID=UPI003D788AF5